jgi:F-type H+-transporting ATPase subunit epsilon
MDGKLLLEIVTPERLVVRETVDEVVLPSVEGYMGVLPGHAPLLAQLDIGEVSYRIGDRRKYLAISGGFAEVLRNSVKVLARTCEPAEEIDPARAKQAQARATDALRERQSETDFSRAEIRLKRAIARLNVHAHGPG